jgi:hypothetical protein
MKQGLIAAILFVSMITTAPTGIAQEATPTTTPDAPSRATKTLTELQADLDQAEAKVNELASGLRADTVVSDDLSLQDVEQQSRQQLQQLEQAIKAELDAKLQLQHAQLDEAESRITASRNLLDERRNQQADIVAKRLKNLLSIPPEQASPQAVLDAWENCLIAKDYERFVVLLSDDEADRMAGMLIQSMQSMSLMLGLMEQSDANFDDQQTQQIRAILYEISQHKRANPPPSALAAMEKVTNILPAVFYQMGAASNGTPLEPPRLTASEYAALLRQASGILTDSRAFCVAMLKAASAMDKDDSNSQPIPSQWKIEVDGTRAIATQAAMPVDQTITETSQVTLVLENGRWTISQLGSDEELLQAVNGSVATIQQDAPPQDDVVNPLSESPPSAQFSLSSPPPTSGGFLPSPPLYYTTPESLAEIIKRKMQGRWVVDEIFDGTGKTEADTSIETGKLSITVTGNVMRYFSGDQELPSPILILTETVTDNLPTSESEPLAVDLIYDPNGEAEVFHAIIECDGDSLRICQSNQSANQGDGSFRPKLFVPGSKVSLCICHRAADLNGEIPRNDSTHGANSGADKKASPLGLDNATVDHESTDRFDWSAFPELLPESGSVLFMFDNESDVGKQMLPIAERVTENASVRLIKLPQTDWPGISAPPATHFVLMKDRQLVGTRTGLMTESRLTDFVAKADDWLTPRSTGVSENSLVRIDCYINPGRDNIGSQHGGAYSLTAAVIAVHEDQALLLGPESIAEYIDKGYACVAIVRDETGKQKQMPLDVVLNEPVPLLPRSNSQQTSAIGIGIRLGDGESQEIPLPLQNSLYPKWATMRLDAYDVGTAIYHLRGAHGLTAVKLAAVDDAPKKDQRVLSGSFTRDQHFGPIHGFRSPMHWQSQTVSNAGDHIYGGNLNGAELLEVLCPTTPAPSGFTFNEHGHLIGRYALGHPTEKDMTHTVFKPYTTHSVLQAALEKIDAPGLRTALAQTLEESHESLRTSPRESAAIDEADKPLYSGHPISWWLDSYWDNATATSQTAENTAQEYLASEAIRKLRDLPECKAAIEAALEKWFESVEHEVSEIQLVRAARCIVIAAGPEYQELAVAYLFMIWRQLPTLSLDKQIERSGEEIELNDLLKQLVVNDELAIQFAERLTNGTSSDRSFVTYYLFSSTGLKDEKDPKVVELNAWLRNHRDLFIPAFAAALKDEGEHVRWFSLSSLICLDLKHANVLSTLTSVIESDASPKVRWLAVEMLSSKEILSVAKTQNIELAPLMIKTLESDSSFDVRCAALSALMAMDKDSELVHKTLMEWARCKERLQVEHAFSLMLRNHETGDRPQSIDELIELLSDPEWGAKVEVNYNNWSTHHRWARQYAIAILGQYAADAHRAIPTLEAEVARNNKDTLSFTTAALDSVRGYCPDRPIDKLQGEWEFVSMQKPEGSSPFFDLQTSSDQQSASLVTISGTQLRLGDRVLAEFSHYRSGSRQGVALLLDPDGKKRHCHGGYNFKGGPSPEYLIVEVSELLNHLDATHATKQIYKFRSVKK